MLSFLKSPKSPKTPKFAVSSEKVEETTADPVQQSSPVAPDQPALTVSEPALAAAEPPKTELEAAPQGNTHGSEEGGIAPSTTASATPSATTDTPASLTPAEPQNPYGKHSDGRRFSFRSFTFLNKSNEPKSPRKYVMTADEEHTKETKASAAYLKQTHKPRLTGSDKRAKESAVVIRSLIVGSTAGQSLKGTKAVSRTEVGRVKGLLLQPKSANQVITHLRAFDLKGDGSVGDDTDPEQFSKPVHAVCLDGTDDEVQDRHFKRLNESSTDSSVDYPSIATASINSVASMFEGMHLINLITTADLGLGQPGDGEGILAGAVPTAATVISGIQQITPQLMALGYATGKAVTPDHSVVHPPLDRISIFTYWWGLEIALPQRTLSYLESAKSISSAVINFLTALSLMNEGVREVLPFVRYIGQFIDFEFDSIKKENCGKGVVCAATWVMPAALVPRPWDFPPPLPPKPIVQEAKADTDLSDISAAPAADEPSVEEPRQSEASQSVFSQESEATPPIPSQPPVLPELIVSSPSSVDTLGPSPLTA